VPQGGRSKKKERKKEEEKRERYTVVGLEVCRPDDIITQD